MAATTEIGQRAPEQGAADGATAVARDRWIVAGYVLTAVLALAPVLRMIRIVLDASMLQYADYWMMLPTFTGPDGGLDVAGLFEFQNHPVVIPKLLYWINIHLFSGSNVALGLVVVAIALAQLAVIALLLQHSALRPIERMAMFVLAAALLFDLVGTWNFAKAMSGTAWLTANVFALTAIYLRSRDRPVPAGALAALAAISYGTGVVAWAAVMATGASRRGLRDAWREWPYAVGLLATAVWYRVAAHQADVGWPTVSEFVELATGLYTSVLGLHGPIGTLVGLVAFLGTPILIAALARTSRVAGMAGWVGVATFGWLAIVEITIGRGKAILYFAEQDRYASLPALGWLGFAALLCATCRTASRRLVARNGIHPSVARASTWAGVAITVPLFVGAATAGQGRADAIVAEKGDQELREISLHLEIADGTKFLVGPFGEATTVTDILKGTGNYPFVDGWDLDCGLLDDEVDPAPAPDGASVGTLRDAERAFFLKGAPRISGHLTTDRPVRCVVVTDARDRVIGAGSLDGSGFVAIARNDAREYRAYAVLEGDPRAHRLDGRVVADQGGQLTVEDAGAG